MKVSEAVGQLRPLLPQGREIRLQPLDEGIRENG